MKSKRKQIQAKRVEIEGIYFVLSEHSDVFGIDDTPPCAHSPALSSANTFSANKTPSISPPPLKKDRMTLFLGETPRLSPGLQSHFSPLPPAQPSSSSSAITTEVLPPVPIVLDPEANPTQDNAILFTQTQQPEQQKQQQPQVKHSEEKSGHESMSNEVLEQKVRNDVSAIVVARLAGFFERGKFADQESMVHLTKHIVNVIANKRIGAKKFEITEDGKKRIEDFVDKSMCPKGDESFIYDCKTYAK